MTPAPLQSVGSARQLPRRVLVLGCTGMVGQSWTKMLHAKGIEYAGVSRPQFDLNDPESIARCITKDFDLVVNAAAWTDVDGAQTDTQSAHRANAQAVAEIAQLCKQAGSTLITYSTDYVFSGNADSPYPIDAPIDPINAYGQSKALGETMLAQSGASYILIRTSWVYAPWGANFVRTIHGLAQSRNQLRVVNDQRGRPTSAQHLAQSSLDLFNNGALGIWHLTDENECTWFEFATQIARTANTQCDVQPCSSDEYPRPAARPAYSTLDISTSMQLIGPLGSWQEHLEHTLNQLPVVDNN